MHRILTLFLFSLVWLLPLIRFSTARPTIEPPSGLIPVSKTPQPQRAWTPRHHGQDLRTLSSKAEGNLLEKRTPPNFSHTTIKLKMMTFQANAMIIPVSSAARALENFYNSILINAAGVWRSEPQRDILDIIEGRFRLSFVSMGDTIPWNFVKDLAELLLECARRGLTELFDVIYMDDTGKVAVSIALRLTDGDSSSSGSGSGSGSGPDYREGSIPSVGSPYD